MEEFAVGIGTGAIIVLGSLAVFTAAILGPPAIFAPGGGYVAPEDWGKVGGIREAFWRWTGWVK